MKKILMMTAFALASLAAAQDTTTPPPPPTDAAPVTPPAPAEPAAPTETPAAPTETPAAPTQTPAAPTETPAAPAETAAPVTGTGTPAESYTRAQEFAVQADVAYPVPFYDRTLWKASVDSAYAAAQGENGNRDYKAYLGQLYTKTQWWINAYRTWSELGELTDTEKDYASLSAAKLAYIALQRGDTETARTYVTQGMTWKDTPSLQAIMSRLP